MNYSISNTAEYGEYVTGPRLINAATKAEMKRVLEDINRAASPATLGAGEQGGAALVQGDARAPRRPSIEEVGERLRAMMPWIAKNKLVDKAKN